MGLDRTKFYIWDIETYPTAFTMSIIRADGKQSSLFEISTRHNHIERLFKCLDYLRDNDCYMVGFNNLGFDYPVLHKLIEIRDTLPKTSAGIASKVYMIAQKQIESFKGIGFGFTVKSDERYVKQIDLFKIHHFDNKAKSTSLKMLEFNMRSRNIEDLPYPVGMRVQGEEIDILLEYNMHDVKETLKFFDLSIPQIEFRLDLTEKYQRDFINHNDTKIGKDYFIMRMEEANIPTKKIVDGKTVVAQTKRSLIKLKDCMLDYYDFTLPQFIAVKEWLNKQIITETKGVFSEIPSHRLGDVAQYAEMEVKRKKFKGKPTDDDLKEFYKEYPDGWVEEEELKATEYLFDENGEHVLEYKLDAEGCVDLTKKPKKARTFKKSYWKCWKEASCLNVVIDGFRYDFGTGGIHGSIENKIVKSSEKWRIIDQDVASFYPNLAISNRIYPKHLTEKFCDIYQDVYEQRKNFPKGSVENAMLKLALNGVFGESNNQYSCFYDPQFTISITVSGQLTLCLLVDMYYRNNVKFKIIAINTDGVTFCVDRNHYDKMKEISDEWQRKVKLTLEEVEYEKMFIRDVNSYISVYKEN